MKLRMTTALLATLLCVGCDKKEGNKESEMTPAQGSLQTSVARGVFDDKGHLSETGLKIFRAFKEILLTSKALSDDRIAKIIEEKSSPSSIPLEDLNALAQDKFKRPNGLERYELKKFNEQFAKYDTPEVRAAFKELGNLDALHPSQQHYDYILVNGSTVPNMRERVMMLNDLVTQKKIDISKSQIIFLSGDRDLFPWENQKKLMDTKPFKANASWKAPQDLPKNEYEAAKFVWAQLDLDPALQKAQVVYVNAPKPLGKAGKLIKKARPSTFDTVATWLKTNPKPGSCLVISSNPHVAYQGLTTQLAFEKNNINPKDFPIEAVGSSAGDNVKLAVLLDDFARTIYTQVQREKLYAERGKKA